VTPWMILAGRTGDAGVFCFLFACALMSGCTTRESRVSDGYVIVGAAGPLYTLRVGERFDEVAGAAVPGHIVDSARQLVVGAGGNPKCSRFFTARSVYVVVNAPACDRLAQLPNVFLALTATGEAIKATDSTGRVLGRLMAKPGMLPEALASICPYARDKAGRRVPEDFCT
jgi:hypothetical protein